MSEVTTTLSTVATWFPTEAPVEVPALRRIGIVGAGESGATVTQWCVSRGFGALVNDTDYGALRGGIEIIRRLFKEAVVSGSLSSGEAHKLLGGIGITTDLRDFEDCDIVIEAISPDPAAKREVFKTLGGIVRPDCLLAAASPLFPFAEAAALVPNPGRVIGLHFFPPVGGTPLVELALGTQATREIAERAAAFARQLDKQPLLCRQAPGLFVARVAHFLFNAACQLWEEGVSVGAIDGAMCEWGWCWGPLRMIDEEGTQAVARFFAEMARVHPGHFVPSGLCQRMWEAGLLGRNHGASSGFYVYADGQETPNPALAAFAPAGVAGTVTLAPEAIRQRLHRALGAEVRRALAEGIVKTADEADFALITGLGFPLARGGLLRSGADRA